MASGFHGGGGAVKTDEEGMKGIPTGCMCGALAAGVLVLGILYGRTAPVGPGLDASVICPPICTSGFRKSWGENVAPCSGLFTTRSTAEHSCKDIYKKGAELAVEVALSAPALVPGLQDAEVPSEVCEEEPLRAQDKTNSEFRTEDRSWSWKVSRETSFIRMKERG